MLQVSLRSCKGVARSSLQLTDGVSLSGGVAPQPHGGRAAPRGAAEAVSVALAPTRATGSGVQGDAARAGRTRGCAAARAEGHGAAALLRRALGRGESSHRRDQGDQGSYAYEVGISTQVLHALRDTGRLPSCGVLSVEVRAATAGTRGTRGATLMRWVFQRKCISDGVRASNRSWQLSPA
jgi:hypothetical protein